MGTLGLISLGVGAAQGGLGLFSQFQQANQESAAKSYESTLAIAQAAAMNRAKERARGRAIDAYNEQSIENMSAAGRAMASEQQRFNEQMYGFAMNRQSMMADRLKAVGQAAAAERYGTSAQRLRNVDVIGAYGRQNALFSETVGSAQKAFNKNLENVNRLRYDADRTAAGQLAGSLDQFMPVMANTGFNIGGQNQALMIGQSALSGVSTGLGMFSSLGGKIK